MKNQFVKYLRSGIYLIKRVLLPLVCIIDIHLFKPVLFPLLGVIVISIFLMIIIPSDNGFFINIITEVLGIIIVVFYVNCIIKYNESKKWYDLNKHISAELNYFKLSAITEISLAYCNNKQNFEEIIYAHKYFTSDKVEFLKGRTLTTLQTFNKEDFESFLSKLEGINNQLKEIFKTFESKLNHNIYYLIIKIQDTIAMINREYNTVAEHYIHNKFDIDDECLELKAYFFKSISNDVEELLSNLSKISDNFV